MEYRTVTPEEKLIISRMQSLAFNFSINENEIRDEIAKGEYSGENTYGAIDEKGRVTAGMEAIPFTMWFDGHKVPMTGIGGVVSAPESRRSGNIKGLFRKVLDDAYEKGVVFSHLYPFSHDYYRQFGYEHVGAAVRYKMPVGPARKLRQTGVITEFIGDEASAELKGKIADVYESYASRHNIMISRTQKTWDSILKITHSSADRLYYWVNGGNEPKAWVKFEKKQEELIIKDIAWVDNESMLGILQFIGMYEGAVKELIISTGPELVAELYWPDLYSIKAERNWLGMNRIINVRRGLELMRKPSGKAEVIIKVNDDFAAWNNNTYAVEYENGLGTVKETDKLPDIELTQTALVQLMLGVYEPQAVLKRVGVSMKSENKAIIKMSELFPKKNIMINDYF